MNWVCPQCEYLNQPLSCSCEVCGSVQESRSRSISRTSSRSSSPSPLRSPSRSPSPSPSRSRSRSRSIDGQERALGIALAYPSSLNRNDLLLYLESQFLGYPRALLILVLEYYVHSPHFVALWDTRSTFEALLPHTEIFHGNTARVDAFRSRLRGVDDLSVPGCESLTRGRSIDRGDVGSRNSSPDFRGTKKDQQEEWGDGSAKPSRSGSVSPVVKIQFNHVEGDLLQLDRFTTTKIKPKDFHLRKPSISNSLVSDTESELGDDTDDDEDTPALVHLRQQLRTGQDLRLSIFVMHGCQLVCPSVELMLTNASASRWTVTASALR